MAAEYEPPAADGETTMELYAWVGDDEFDGSWGIKSALAPVGWIPLAFKGDHLDRALNTNLVDQLQAQVDAYGKQVELVRFVFRDVVRVIKPSN